MEREAAGERGMGEREEVRKEHERGIGAPCHDDADRLVIAQLSCHQGTPRLGTPKAPQPR